MVKRPFTADGGNRSESKDEAERRQMRARASAKRRALPLKDPKIRRAIDEGDAETIETVAKFTEQAVLEPMRTDLLKALRPLTEGAPTSGRNPKRRR